MPTKYFPRNHYVNSRLSERIWRNLLIWIYMVLLTDIRPCVTLVLKSRGSVSGNRDSGKIGWKDYRITSGTYLISLADVVLYMSSISRDFDNSLQATVYEEPIKRWVPIKTHSQISIKISLIMHNIRFLYILYLKNGYGAKLGVVWIRLQLRILSIWYLLRWPGWFSVMTHWRKHRNWRERRIFLNGRRMISKSQN